MPIVILYFLISIVCFYLGRLIRFAICGSDRLRDSGAVEMSCDYLTGLVFYLTLISAGRLIGLGWGLVTVIPFMFLLVYVAKPELLKVNLKLKTDFNFLIWFLVILGIGISIFQTVDGVQTPWVNNYGDLAFHLGMINSITFSPSFPLDFHLYAGAPFSYPFFINLWSSLLWLPDLSYTGLSTVFMLQWVTVWTLIYFLLKGGRNILLPWILLLGGGSLFNSAYHDLPALFVDGGINYGAFLKAGYPWHTFINAVWVPQRTAMLGLAASLAVLHNFESGIELKDKRNLVWLAAFTAGLSIMCHVHFWIVTCGYCALRLIAQSCQKEWRGKEQLRFVFKTGLFFLPFLLFLPFMEGKRSIIDFMPGWLGSDLPSGASRLSSVAQMQIENFGIGIVLAGCWVFFSRRWISGVVLLVLYLAGNLIKISYWEWDQIKYFIALYGVIVFLWSRSERKLLYYLHFTTVVLLIPALLELAAFFYVGNHHTVFTEKEVDDAIYLREVLDKGSVLAAAPSHNSTAVLTGVPLYMGYPGSLWSHGINYRQRELRLKDLTKLTQCDSASEDICPDYLLWTEKDRKFWKTEPPLRLYAKESNGLYYELRNK